MRSDKDQIIMTLDRDREVPETLNTPVSVSEHLIAAALENISLGPGSFVHIWSDCLQLGWDTAPANAFFTISSDSSSKIQNINIYLHFTF